MKRQYRVPDFRNYFRNPLTAFERAKKFFEKHKGKHVHKSAEVHKLSVVESPCFIGPGTVVGPFAHIRPYTFIGSNCFIGPYSQVKASIILNNTNIPHLNYVGDSIVGENCNLGAGTKIANLRFDERNIKIECFGERVNSGRRKLGAVIGSNVKTGVNCSIMPGVKVGSNSWIGPGVVVDKDIDENVFYGFRNGSIVKIKKEVLLCRQ